MSTLGQFLKARKSNTTRVPEESIVKWQIAVERLVQTFREVVSQYKSDGLSIDEREISLRNRGSSQKLKAFTISFEDFQIAFVPKAGSVGDGERALGKVELSSGANVVWLLWRGQDKWVYKWEYPEFAEGPQPLTKEAIEELIEELLS